MISSAMKIVSYLTLASAAVEASSIRPRAPAAWTNYNNNKVYDPPDDYTSWRVLYARTVQLPDLSLLLTFEKYDNTVDLAYWPIYKSTDGGATFSEMTRVQDQANGWGVWYNPHLYTLPQDFGGYPKGTILLAGESVPRDLSEAWIDLYASTDEGETWSFVSHIVYGAGPETVENGNDAVWEPYLMIYDDQLVCYYSTQTDPNHAQKLSHVTSNDMQTWSDEVDDVAQPNYGDRPGMATVAYSPVSQQYIMTFEYCGSSFAGGCPVHYKISDNPLRFGDKTPTPILPDDPDRNPNGSPYIIWTEDPNNAASGLFIMNGNSREEVFVNTDALDADGWKAVEVGQWSAYSRSLNVITTPEDSAAGGQRKLLIANGGNIGCSGSCQSFVATGLVDVPTYPA